MRFACSLLALSLALSASGARAAVQLTLKAAASVPGPRVTLAELAAISGDDSGRLGAMDFGPAPLPGYTTRLSRAEIERTLRARGNPHRLDGAPAVAVERATQAADGGAALMVAEQHLRQRLQGRAARIDLALAAPLQEMQLPPGKVEFKPRASAAGAMLQRRTTVWLDVLVDGVFVRSVAPVFEVKAFAPVLVASRDLAAGATPACATLELREADLAALGGMPAAAECGAVQGRLKRALAQGAPLLKTDLQAELAVTQGDTVGLRVADGAILIEARALALAGGNVGQRIDVKPAGGARAVRAEIIAPGVVTLTGK